MSLINYFFRISMRRKLIIIFSCIISILVISIFALCVSSRAQHQKISVKFKSELNLYRTVCATQLIGQQAAMTDELISQANGNIPKLFLIAEPLSHTTLVGRQLEVLQFLWNHASNFETQLRIAKLASQTQLIGMQASTIDILINESWGNKTRLTNVMNILSHTQLVGRQQQVLARLQTLGA